MLFVQLHDVCITSHLKIEPRIKTHLYRTTNLKLFAKNREGQILIRVALIANAIYIPQYHTFTYKNKRQNGQEIVHKQTN